MDITIGGNKLNDLFYINNVQGVHDMPPARGLTNAFSVSSGSNYCGTVFDERVITITGTILMSDGLLLADKMDMLKKVIAPTGEKEIILGAYPNRYIMGRYEGSMNLEQIVQMGMFTLTFYCSDPFYYDRVQKTSTTSIASWDCKNDGTWESSKLTMELTLMGDCTITNRTTNKSLVLTGNKKVTVDFDRACIIGGVADNANTCYKSGEFFELIPGSNMIISSRPAIYRYRSCYL